FFFAGNVNLPIGKHWRRAVSSGLQSLPTVNLGAGLGVQAPRDAAVADAVKVFAVGHRRWHVRAVLKRPQMVRAGDVAAPARAKSRQGFDARRRVNHAVNTYR